MLQLHFLGPPFAHSHEMVAAKPSPPFINKNCGRIQERLTWVTVELSTQLVPPVVFKGPSLGAGGSKLPERCPTSCKSAPLPIHPSIQTRCRLQKILCANYPTPKEMRADGLKLHIQFISIYRPTTQERGSPQKQSSPSARFITTAISCQPGGKSRSNSIRT